MKRPLNVAGGFWLAYVALLVCGIACAWWH